MRILFVCAAGTAAGKERQTLAFMKFLKGRGHEVFCAVSSWNDGGFPALLNKESITYETIRLGFISISLQWRAVRMTAHQIIYLPSLWWNYRRLLRSWNPDIVVHSSFEHVLALGPFFGKGPNVFHVHDIFPESKRARRLFQVIGKNCDLFIGVSKSVCQNLVKLGQPEDKIRLVYNGIETPDVELVRHIQGDTISIGIVGQIGPWKGHEVLIQALSKLKALNWRLSIVGSGAPSNIDHVRQLLVAHDLTDRAQLSGSKDGLQQIYGDLDLVCVPSLVSESFGLAAAEPGLFGLPVIVSNLGGLPEIVVDGETGLVFPPGDSEALSAAIASLLTNPSRMLFLGAAARTRVLELFSINSTGMQMENVFRSIRNDPKR